MQRIRSILKNRLNATHPSRLMKKLAQMQRIRGIFLKKSLKCNASEPSNEKVGSNATHPGHLFEKIT